MLSIHFDCTVPHSLLQSWWWAQSTYVDYFFSLSTMRALKMHTRLWYGTIWFITSVYLQTEKKLRFFYIVFKITGYTLSIVLETVRYHHISVAIVKQAEKLEVNWDFTENHQLKNPHRAHTYQVHVVVCIFATHLDENNSKCSVEKSTEFMKTYEVSPLK